MIYHIVVGDEAASPLQEAIFSEPSLQGELLILKDILHVGRLKPEENQSFSELRSAYWQQIASNEKNQIKVDDLERLLSVSNELSKDQEATAWFWMAPAPADVCAYYWLLSYLSKHTGRLLLVNIANLPFLNEQGKVFYPRSFSEILPKEIIKARKLARPVTVSEAEVDMEEWRKLVEENAAIRVYEGGKKIISKEEDHYDGQLISFCSHQFQKASRILRQALTKYAIPTGDVHLAWRLRRLSEEGKLLLQGDASKQPNEFEVRLPGEVTVAENQES